MQMQNGYEGQDSAPHRAVGHYECLWRVESAEYKDRDRKYIAYEKIAEILEWPGMLPDFADNVQLQTDRLRNR